MFLVVNLIEIDVFALKEEICMSNTKFLAEVGRLRSHNTETTRGGSRWHKCVQHLLGFARGLCRGQCAGVAARVSFCEVLISSFRINGKMARWVWAHLPHGSVRLYPTSLSAPTDSV